MPVALVLLDLSAAFDTLDHEQLLNRLSKTFGLKDVVLNWFSSYLSNRSQSVKVHSTLSDAKTLPFGVPQGSVLGPLLFTLFTSPISTIISKFPNINYHLYADDTQIYISLTPSNITTAVPVLQNCLIEIQAWMNDNRLQARQVTWQPFVAN